MRFLVLSDIHGAELKIEDLIDRTSPDLIILPGDVPSTIDLPSLLITLAKRQKRSGYIRNLYSRFIDRINIKQIRSLKSILQKLLVHKIPIVVIHGNTESAQTRNWLKLYALRKPLIHYIADTHVKLDDILFVGHGWVPFHPASTHVSSPGEIDEETSRTIILDAIGRAQQRAKLKILVSHSPPYGTKIDYSPIEEVHQGSKVIRTVLDTNHFDGVISGHLHEAYGSMSTENWWGINAGAAVEDTACLVDVGTHQIKWMHNIIRRPNIESMIYSRRRDYNYDSQ